MIYILTSKNAASLGLGKKNSWVKLLPLKPEGKSGPSARDMAKHDFKIDDRVYLDISGLSALEIKKIFAQIKKTPSSWGVIDPKGAAEDPASYFFEGACDYIGPGLVKKGLAKKRFDTALLRADQVKSTALKDTAAAYERKAVKLPIDKSGSWESVRVGSEGNFFFLFVALSGKSSLRLMVGETVFISIRKRLREVLQQALLEADALLWIETENNMLFLIPPRAPNAKAAVEAAIKIILNTRLITIEKLDLTILAEFTFAFHYGKTLFQAPGKTGTIVSEAINFIFHLGSKRAETGRLTISADVPKEAIPEELEDLFIPAGVFEKMPLRHSKRFVLKK